MVETRKAHGFKYQKYIVVPDKSIQSVKSNPLTSRLYVTDIGFFPVALYHFIERNNGAKEYIIIFCVDGEGYCLTKGKTHSLNKGDLIIIEKNAGHKYWASAKNPWSIYFFHIDGVMADNYYAIINSFDTLRIPIDGSSKLLELFEECYETLSYYDSYSAMLLAAKICEHIFSLIIHFAVNEVKPIEDSKKIIEKLIVYMNNNLDGSITLENLAKEVSFSVSHMSRIFKNATGYAPLEYFLRLKIQKACNLIHRHNYTVKEVSAVLGFVDQSYFSRLFKKYTGKSPIDYKRDLSNH